MIDQNNSVLVVFNEMAEIYQQKYMNVDIYHEALEYLLNNLKATDSILDLACGPGNVLRYLCNRNKDLNLTGMDFSEEMIRLARLNVPTAKFEVADCRHAGYIGSRYQAVVCSFLLPYLTEKEVENLFADVRNLLVPNGYFYLGFITEAKNGSEIVKSSKGHAVNMNYYSIDFVLEVLRSNKFQIGFSKPYQSNNINQQQNDIIIVANYRPEEL